VSFAIVPANTALFTASMTKRALAVRASTLVSTRLAAEKLLEETLPVTPMDSGDLRSTGRVVMVGPGIFTVQFGGPEAPYAYKVHEDLEAYHEAPTKAKYLEGTYLEHKGEYAAAIKAAAVGALYAS
jgi:hypothetical protein